MMRAMPPMTPPTIAPMSGLEVLLPALSDPVVAPGSAPDEVGVEVLRGREINAQLLDRHEWLTLSRYAQTLPSRPTRPRRSVVPREVTARKLGPATWASIGCYPAKTQDLGGRCTGKV